MNRVGLVWRMSMEEAMAWALPLLVACTLLIVSGCSEGRSPVENRNQPRTTPLAAEVAELRKQLEKEVTTAKDLVPVIAEMKNRLARVEQAMSRKEEPTEIATLKKQVAELRLEILLLKLEKDPYKTIVLDPSSTGFQRLDSNLASFLVGFQDAQPYLDGYKVAINVGNISNADYDGFKMKVKWGRKYVAQKESSYDGWRKSLQEKDVSFTETLRPGRWNKIELILSPAKPESLGHLELSLETNRATLLRP